MQTMHQYPPSRIWDDAIHPRAAEGAAAAFEGVGADGPPAALGGIAVDADLPPYLPSALPLGLAAAALG